MQQKNTCTHLPPPRAPTGVHPYASPFILFLLARKTRFTCYSTFSRNPFNSRVSSGNRVRSNLFFRSRMFIDNVEKNFAYFTSLSLEIFTIVFLLIRVYFHTPSLHRLCTHKVPISLYTKNLHRFCTLILPPVFNFVWATVLCYYFSCLSSGVRASYCLPFRTPFPPFSWLFRGFCKTYFPINFLPDRSLDSGIFNFSSLKFSYIYK